MTTVPASSPVLGRKRPATGVAARDFARPRRLAAEHARALAKTLAGALPALERELSAASGLTATLALAETDPIGEADAEALLAGLAEPLVVLRFPCGKAPAWLVWEPRAAVATVETLLGSRAPAAEPRALSAVESRVAAAFLGELARGVAGALGLAAGAVALVQSGAELGSWRDGGADAQPYRLEVRLALGLAGETSELRLYLPAVTVADAPPPALPKQLPAHLERVEVEVCATLPGCELLLDQLLALEAGDVIPLAARVDDPATLVVDGLTLARARIGRHRGRLAVAIESLGVESESAA